MTPRTMEVKETIAQLRELKYKQESLGGLEGSVADLRRRREDAEKRLKNAKSAVNDLPTNNYRTQSDRLREKVWNESERRPVLVKAGLVAVIVVVALIIIAILLTSPAPRAFTDGEDGRTSFLQTSIGFVVVLALACIIYSFTESMSPFDDFFDWFTWSGGAFLFFCWLCPIAAFIGCMVFLYQYSPFLLILPPLMLASMITARILQDVDLDDIRDYTSTEKRLLEQASALDKRNKLENERRRDAATREYREALETIESQLREATAQLEAAKDEVENNHLLPGSSMGYVDGVISLLESGSVTSVEDALRLLRG